MNDENNRTKLIKILKYIVLSIVIPSLAVYFWLQSIWPSNIQCHFYIDTIQLPKNSKHEKNEIKKFQMMKIFIVNTLDEDVDLNFIEIKYIKNYEGVSFGLPKNYSAINYTDNITENTLNIKGTIKLPAKDLLSVYIWAEDISTFPVINIKVSKGSINIEQNNFFVGNKIKFYICENIYILIALIVIAIIIIIYLLVRK